MIPPVRPKAAVRPKASVIAEAPLDPDISSATSPRSQAPEQTLIQNEKFSLLKLGGWIALWILLLDVAANWLFPLPEQTGQTPNALTRYFHYGRSIEGKLDRFVGDTVETSDPIIASGWLDPRQWESLPTKPQEGNDLLFASYGMSFTSDVSDALIALDKDITLRSIGGPSSPPNHSFAAYLADDEGRNADVVMFGILASSVKRLGSLSGTSWTYEHPAPYTYPYYWLNAQGQLEAVDPVIDTAEEFVAAYRQKDENWQQLRAQMQRYDRTFDALVFNRNFSDRSALMRLLRRGWANHVRSRNETEIFTPGQGFDTEAAEIQTLKAILSEFVSTAKDNGQTPIILLLQDQGYEDSLYRALGSHINSLDTLMLSTHSIAPAEDPTNFIEDGHFTPAANRKIAQELQALIRTEHPKTPTGKSAEKSTQRDPN